MKKNKDLLKEIREKAENLLREKAETLHDITVDDTNKLIHELQVHQIELEMQNEELRRAQEELEESRNRYFELYDLAPVGYFTLDLNGLIIEANFTFANILGVERHFLIKKLFSHFVAPDSQNIYYIHHEQTLETKIKQICEFKLKKKDGSLLYGQMTSIAILDTDGNVNQIRATITDITAQKQAKEKEEKLKEQLLQSQKMESIRTLTGRIAHDFNNLLMAIQGHVDLFFLDVDSNKPNYEYLEDIEQHVKNGAELAKQLVNFARKGKYEVNTTDINQLIDKGIEMFDKTKKAITIYKKCSDDLETVEVDQSQIEQAFLNLYINAGQAMPDGGKLYIETQNVNIDKTYVKDKEFNIKPGKYVKISVTDTGVGMDKETERKIFEPFFTTKDTGEGIGLGLASSYGIVKNHGGFIDVYSEKGKGTTFNIYLPVSEKNYIKEADKTECVKKTGTETILLVDDEKIIRNITEKMLNKLGYQVLTAANGLNAVEIYKNNKDKTDMVILDMIMPEMGGSETYDELKKINPDIKVLLASGYSIDEDVSNILERGCNGFIQKPFSLNKLLQKIRDILGEE